MSYADEARAKGVEPNPFFTENLELRPVVIEQGSSPASARALNWFRFPDALDSDPYLNFGRLLPLLDTLGITAFRRAYGHDFLQGIAPTLQLAAHFYAAEFGDGWFLAESFGEHAAQGLISTRARVWSSGGALLAQSVSQMSAQAGEGAFVKS